ncbi:hypothetical protein B0J18DRAFT_46303 [Chaetomium sp. MPI-SDFR-AT-0129]|nr:hypothetical protein B0J18DRAFT_46303 [Chaetomium sp. MPI-SDFR-AT-0129]
MICTLFTLALTLAVRRDTRSHADTNHSFKNQRLLIILKSKSPFPLTTISIIMLHPVHLIPFARCLNGPCLTISHVHHKHPPLPADSQTHTHQQKKGNGTQGEKKTPPR